MSQLKMVWLTGTPVKSYKLPKGYTISNFSREADKIAWGHICENGLCDGSDGISAFDGTISCNPNIDPCRDTFFLDYNGEHIGTVTAYIIPHDDYISGDMHMVSIRTDFRGKGLSKYLTMITLKHLQNIPRLKYIELTTDDWRRPAIIGYLSAGFQPVEDDFAAKARWQLILDDLLICMDELQLLNENFSKDILLKKQHSRGRVVIASGDFSAEKRKRIAEYLWQLSGSRFPNCLLIYMNFIDDNYLKIKDYWEKSGCTFELFCLSDSENNEKALRERIQDAGIICISSENADSFMKIAYSSHTEKHLRDACEHGKILFGINSGAICLSASGSDCKLGTNAHRIKGLGLFPYNVMLHYNKNKSCDFLSNTEKIHDKMIFLEEGTTVSMVDGDVQQF